MFSKKYLVYIGICGILLIMLACDFSLGGTELPIEDTLAPESENLQATMQVLITQMAQTSQARIQAMPPTTMPLPPTAVPPTLTPQPAVQPTVEIPQPVAPTVQAELIGEVSIDRGTFYCVKSDGPTTLTITAGMSDIERGLAIFYRLYEKNSGTMTDWQNVSMRRKGTDTRTFTFDANVWDGTNNFFYPPGFGESWFQFQLVSGDAKDRTPVYRADVTFHPCAQ